MCGSASGPLFDMQTVVSYPIVFTHDEEPFELKFEVKPNSLPAHAGWLPYTTEEGWLEYLKSHPLPDNRVID